MNLNCFNCMRPKKRILYNYHDINIKKYRDIFCTFSENYFCTVLDKMCSYVYFSIIMFCTNVRYTD